MSEERSTTNRGYGTEHQRERAEWQAVIDQHGAVCTMPVCVEASREIPVGSKRWDLNHDATREGYTGPAHVRCNRGAPSHPEWTEVLPASRDW